MSTFKVMFCDLCVILLYMLAIVFAEDNLRGTTTDVISSGNCSCGGFESMTPPANATPLLSQSPGLVVMCDEDGQTTCKSLCEALATATKAKGPEMLCNKLKHANELKLSAFYKVCDRAWAYADITAEEALCCNDGKVQRCPFDEEVNVTLTHSLPLTRLACSGKSTSLRQEHARRVLVFSVIILKLGLIFISN